MKQQYVLLGVFSVLFIAYQNFGSLSAEDLRTLQTMHEMSQLKPPETSIQIPNKGRDLASVTSGWVEDQGREWLDGADQRLVETFNEKLNRWINSNSDEHTTSHEEFATGSNSGFLKKKLRFARINSMELQLETNSLVSCSVEPKGAQLDYSKKWSESTSIGLGLRSENSQTQFIFKHNF